MLWLAACCRVYFVQGLHGWYVPNQVSVCHIDIGFTSVPDLSEWLLTLRRFGAVVSQRMLQIRYSGLRCRSECIASLPFGFRRLLWKPRHCNIVGTAGSTGLIGLDRCWITGAGIIGIAGSVFRRFRDWWSKITFLIAILLRLPCLPLLLLSPGLFVVRVELQGRRTVEELVECVEPVFAGGDPRPDFRLKCVLQARPCHVV